ncbi:hypothetical protein GOQ27_11005 [Clostridium sp. D2Q-11]|uniref:Uncharacterized protein n=1 Tax=Anaeromonas frigoriresistens TaxID=2683708 RepID=A0A942UTK9_9FIRM|nr:hypothetical protein [Anaeromonas frigoriresistens]MBS4538994.1 hypothetical protein [Anaeromonas frigoriresistens]
MLKNDMKEILNSWVVNSYNIWMGEATRELINELTDLKEELIKYGITDINIIGFDEEKITYRYTYRASQYTDAVSL